MQLENLRRHGETHYANVIYGNVILLISIAYIGIIALVRELNERRIWKQSRGQLVIPTWVYFVLLSLITISVEFYGFTWEKYVVFIKRFGRVSYSLIPLNIFFALRPNFINYLELVSLHKWTSRLIILFGILHGCGFGIKWIKEGTFWNKTFSFLNSLGAFVMVLTIFLLVFSFRYFRRINYTYFYWLHNVTLWSFVLLVTFHARPGVTYLTIVNLVLLVYQIYYRFFNCYRIESISVREKPHSSLKLVTITTPSNYPSWSVGSHVRLNYPSKWYSPTHPFTIASIPSDTTIKLVVKKSKNFNITKGASLSISVPFYGFSSKFFEFANTTTIICAGSGISFGLPLFSQLLKSGKSKTNLIWIVKTKIDTFILSDFQLATEITIYVTGESEEDHNTRLDIEEASSGLELESISSSESLLNDSRNVNKTKDSLLNIIHGRPELSLALSSLSDDEGNEKYLIACGPAGLISDSKKWASDNKIQFKSELYEM